MPIALRPRALTGRVSLALVLVAGLLSLLAPFQLRPIAAQVAAAPLPPGWPATLQLGMSDGPGGAAALKTAAPFGFRYQYLAGGANTGQGWATWNTNGDFVTYYVRDSASNGITPTFIYYMLLQSNGPCGTCGEAQKDLAHLNDTSTMTALYNDLKLFFQKAGAFPTTTVVLNVEPDLWGYIQQASTNDNAATVPAKVAATGLPELAGLPDTAAGFAQAVRKLRDLYGPNVQFGFHLSIWGTGIDIQYSKPTDAQVDALAARSAAFFNSLGVDYNVAFAEFSDRDAAYYQLVQNDGGAHWMTDADFARHVRYLGDFSQGVNKRLVVWQIPLGNTRMRAVNNTFDHYQDNRVETLLDDASRFWLQQYVQAGVLALLFGRGADGNTCACDAAGDGITNPAPINGNTLDSLSADDDGGFFKQKAQAYYAAGAVDLSGATSAPPPTATPTGTAASPTSTPTPTGANTSPSFVTSATASPGTVAPGGSVAITASVRSATATTQLVDVEVYDPAGAKVSQWFFDNEAFTAGQTKTYLVTWAVPANAALGTYTVKIGVFDPAWGMLRAWNNAATQFSVATAAPTATPTSMATPTPTTTMHVGDLDGTRAKSGSGWKATVTVTIHDASEKPVAGATVSGRFAGSAGYALNASCTTGSNGQCSVASGRIGASNTSVTFTVSGVSGSLTYAPSANHDPDGDSSGTSITINRP